MTNQKTLYFREFLLSESIPKNRGGDWKAELELEQYRHVLGLGRERKDKIENEGNP